MTAGETLSIGFGRHPALSGCSYLQDEYFHATGLPRRIDTPALSVGIVSADLLHLADDLDRLAGAGVELVHMGLMEACSARR